MTPIFFLALLVLAATGAIVLSFAYTLGMYLEGRTNRADDEGPAADLLFVYLIPCLNEERVIGATLDSLRSRGEGRSLVLVVDDGSDDDTAAIVRARADEDVVLLQRQLPEARQGKGAALNAAVRYLSDTSVLQGYPSNRVVVCLLDADGRLDPHAAEVAARSFADGTVGGVQVAVRIGNRRDGLLPRLQDMEFVCYTELFQRCRGQSGFAGLGGNGQFTRLSALRSLGPEPWTPSTLTEDLDLGIRMVLRGWRTVYRPEAQVHQQGLRSLRALIRQRSRWFQGLLQCWHLIPAVARGTRGRIRLDLLHMLLTPVLILAAFLMTLSFLIGPIERALHPDLAFGVVDLKHIAAWYLLTFLPVVLFAVSYRSVSGGSRLRSFALAHAFVLYGLMWVGAGLTALWRMVVGRKGWVKTARLLEHPAGADARHGTLARGATHEWDWDPPTARRLTVPDWGQAPSAPSAPSYPDWSRASAPRQLVSGEGRQ
jgi:1,2-diacylglycerol 3-beta-glucosyltransferase